MRSKKDTTTSTNVLQELIPLPLQAFLPLIISKGSRNPMIPAVLVLGNVFSCIEVECNSSDELQAFILECLR